MGLLDKYKLFILKQFDIHQTIASMLETIYFINTTFSLNSHSFITCEMSTEKGCFSNEKFIQDWTHIRSSVQTHPFSISSEKSANNVWKIINA